MGNWVNLVFNPLVHNEVAATIYGTIVDNEWPIPALGDNFSRTGKQAFKFGESVGEFVKVNRGMSPITRKYQRQISGLPENVEFR